LASTGIRFGGGDAEISRHDTLLPSAAAEQRNEPVTAAMIAPGVTGGHSQGPAPASAV
jgi:hypothetical protein